MTDAARPPLGSAADLYSREWIAEHLRKERAANTLRGEVRELIFGSQDGLVSILTVVAAVSGATFQSFPILVAGIAAGFAGVFSMAAGEYISSKSQGEIFQAQIMGERQEVQHRPGEAEAEVGYLLTNEGLEPDEARHVAAILARYPEVLLRTMVQKELGLAVDDDAGSPLQGGILMGTAFGAGAAIPLLPFLILPPQSALPTAIVLTAGVLFAIGVAKSRWTGRPWLRSGIEVLALAAFAGVAGYVFGTILPQLLGLAGVAG